MLPSLVCNQYTMAIVTKQEIPANKKKKLSPTLPHNTPPQVYLTAFSVKPVLLLVISRQSFSTFIENHVVPSLNRSRSTGL